MNPAEEIVKFWLQEKGYFLQSSIRLPKNKEIDILAVNSKDDKLHIEVSVSVRMANYKLNAKQLAKDFNDRKFKAVASEVEEKLGKKYKRILVVGKVFLKNDDIMNDFVSECKNLNLEILKFENILNEIIPMLSTHTHLNPAIKSVQLASVFGDFQPNKKSKFAPV